MNDIATKKSNDIKTTNEPQSFQALSDENLESVDGGFWPIAVVAGVVGIIWSAGHAKGLQDREQLCYAE